MVGSFLIKRCSLDQQYVPFVICPFVIYLFPIPVSRAAWDFDLIVPALGYSHRIGGNRERRFLNNFSFSIAKIKVFDCQNRYNGNRKRLI